METKTVIVNGMKCGNCKTAVENGLRAIPGIKDITVDLQKQEATIVAEAIDLKKVKSAVEDLGYVFGGLK